MTSWFRWIWKKDEKDIKNRNLLKPFKFVCKAVLSKALEKTWLFALVFHSFRTCRHCRHCRPELVCQVWQPLSCLLHLHGAPPRGQAVLRLHFIPLLNRFINVKTCQNHRILKDFERLPTNVMTTPRNFFQAEVYLSSAHWGMCFRSGPAALNLCPPGAEFKWRQSGSLHESLWYWNMLNQSCTLPFSHPLECQFNSWPHQCTR